MQCQGFNSPVYSLIGGILLIYLSYHLLLLSNLIVRRELCCVALPGGLPPRA